MAMLVDLAAWLTSNGKTLTNWHTALSRTTSELQCVTTYGMRLHLEQSGNDVTLCTTEHSVLGLG